jgi:hypothetical protein
MPYLTSVGIPGLNSIYDAGRLQSGTEPSRFWYFVTFAVGVYVGICYFTGSHHHSALLWGPIGLCLAIPAVVGGRISARLLAAALNLYAAFCIGFGVSNALLLPWYSILTSFFNG